MTATAVIRIVVRNGFSRDMATLLLDDIRRQVTILTQPSRPRPRQSFAH
jgi:glutamate decarboxylase